MNKSIPQANKHSHRVDINLEAAFDDVWVDEDSVEGCVDPAGHMLAKLDNDNFHMSTGSFLQAIVK